MARVQRAGFTLIELVIVLTVLGVLLSIAVPRTVAARTQVALQSAAVQFHGDLVRARVDAVRRNATVTMTKTSATVYAIEHIGPRTLPEGVTFSSAAADQFEFPPFGPSPSGAKSFTLQRHGYTRVVTMTASGMARVE